MSSAPPLTPAKVSVQQILPASFTDLQRRSFEDFFPYLEHIANVDLPLFVDMLAHAGRHSAREILESVEVPTLIVAGERDGFTPMALSEENLKALGERVIYYAKHGQVGPVAIVAASDESYAQAQVFAEAAKAAYQRDPGGDEARQAKVKLVIERYSGLKNSTNGRYIIDMICKENDELLAIYK